MAAQTERSASGFTLWWFATATVVYHMGHSAHTGVGDKSPLPVGSITMVHHMGLPVGSTTVVRHMGHSVTHRKHTGVVACVSAGRPTPSAPCLVV